MTRSLGLLVVLAVPALSAQAWAKPKAVEPHISEITITKRLDKSSTHLFLRANPPHGGLTTLTTPQHTPGQVTSGRTH